MGRVPLDKVKIERVELFHVKMRLKSPFKTSFGVEHERQCVIIKVEAAGGQGWGECVAGEFPGFSYETAETAWHVLSDFFLPALADSLDHTPKGLRSALKGFKGHPLARAGLEMALWDLLGHLKSSSLQELLGGERERVPVGVSIGVQKDLDAMLGVIDRYLQEGYQRIKIKIAPEADADIVRGVRETYPDIRLQVDANSAYSLEDSQRLRLLDDYRLELIEQPFAEDDLVDHATFQSSVKTPICLDESILSERHARQALDLDACRVINIKAGRVSGLIEAKLIHDYCKSRGIPVWCGGMLETNIGRAANLAIASLPGFTLPGDISASDRYYADDIAHPSFRLNSDSTIDVPTLPGLGVEVDSAALERVTLKHVAMEI
jgi:O-succinylbenzoate synthase